MKTGIAVVDIKGLYAKVLEGGFVTDDGVAINPAFPGGNFFSADGIFPSAIEGAVMANEFIKSINKAHNKNIPLYQLSLFNNQRLK